MKDANVTIEDLVKAKAPVVLMRLADMPDGIGSGRVKCSRCLSMCRFAESSRPFLNAGLLPVCTVCLTAEWEATA